MAHLHNPRVSRRRRVVASDLTVRGLVSEINADVLGSGDNATCLDCTSSEVVNDVVPLLKEFNKAHRTLNNELNSMVQEWIESRGVSMEMIENSELSAAEIAAQIWQKRKEAEKAT